MPHILASFGVLTYSQEKNIKNRLQLTGYRLSCIGYRWPLSVRHHTSAIKHILVTVFLCFSLNIRKQCFFGSFRVFRCFRNKNLRDMIKFNVASLAQTLLI